MAITLYGIPRTRASRTLWMLAELGLEYRLERVSPQEGATREAAFLAINPMGQVPTLVDDGEVIFESLAINLHLARKYGGPLAPHDRTEESQMTMWSIWAAASFEPDAHEVIVQTFNLPPEKREPAKLEAALARLKRPLDALETALAKGGGHLVGNRFTVADLNVACIAFYLRNEPRALAGYPGITAWYAAATAREGFRTMLRLREQG